MTRRKFRKLAVSPSLFPFLAVLVCTMGALIVLLVLVVQQARVYASSVSEQRTEDDRPDPEAIARQLRQQEDFEWQREVFEQQRMELAAKLADRRLELSHLEDHIRRLEVAWKQLQAQAAELERVGGEKQASSEQTLQELAQLRAAIDAAQRRLEDARANASKRPPTFAIIPYDGVNGTKRRPIYVECTEHGIIIQPEGIVLRRVDLEGPLGPGNPLDAALRAMREHWARQGLVEVHGEPYPLLIVRPNGTVAYNYAREALKSWDDEFGYELIDADMKLAYPPQDPALREVLTQTVQHARQRQAVLMAAMPNQYEQQAISGFVASPTTGGFRPIGGSGRGSGFGQSGSGASDQAGRGEGRSASQGGGTSTAGSGNQQQQQSGQGQNGQGESGPSSSGSTGGSFSQGSTSPGASAGSQLASAGQGQQGEGPEGQPGEQAASVQVGGRPPGTSGNSPMSAQRGANWAVPKASANATAYKIPVRMVCQADRLTILPRPTENTAPIEVLAGDPLSRTVDEFVKRMWEQIEQWDAAPLGGYWQPILEVYVHPGAEERFLELQQLLSGSGIQVQRQAQ